MKNTDSKSSVGAPFMSVPPNSGQRFLTDYLSMRAFESVGLDVSLNLAQIVFWPENHKNWSESEKLILAGQKL